MKRFFFFNNLFTFWDGLAFSLRLEVKIREDEIAAESKMCVAPCPCSINRGTAFVVCRRVISKRGKFCQKKEERKNGFPTSDERTWQFAGVSGRFTVCLIKVSVRQGRRAFGIASHLKARSWWNHFYSNSLLFQLWTDSLVKSENSHAVPVVVWWLSG